MAHEKNWTDTRVRLFNWPFLKVLARMGMEPDQFIYSALQRAFEVTKSEWVNDAELFYYLWRLNVISTRYIYITETSLYRCPAGRALETQPDILETKIIPHLAGVNVIALACDRATDKRTFGTKDFLRAVLDRSLLLADEPIDRPYTLDLLCASAGKNKRTPASEVPGLMELLQRLRDEQYGAEDFQYAVMLKNGRMAFRVTSVLDDYVQTSDLGLWVPQRALLTHIGNYGLFTVDEIEELEELINNPKAGEAEFQSFFERHPHFLRRWDHREVYPHVYLTREKDGPLIPDFILTNKETSEAAILDLKQARLEGKLVVRDTDNRQRFAQAVMKARAQLLEYRDWFDIPENRRKLKSKVGMEIYRPRLMVIIGRTCEFEDDIERQKLRDHTSDIEIATYDDIVKYAQQRRVIIEGPT